MTNKYQQQETEPASQAKQLKFYSNLDFTYEENFVYLN